MPRCLALSWPLCQKKAAGRRFYGKKRREAASTIAIAPWLPRVARDREACGQGRLSIGDGSRPVFALLAFSWREEGVKENPGFWSSSFRCFQGNEFFGGGICGINRRRVAASRFAKRRCVAQVLFLENASKFCRGKKSCRWAVGSGQWAAAAFRDAKERLRPRLPADCGSLVAKRIYSRMGGGFQYRVLDQSLPGCAGRNRSQGGEEGGQVHVFGQRLLSKRTLIRRKMDQSPSAL
jgi:hypothetical protein